MKNMEQIIQSGILQQFVLGLTTEEENQQVRRYVKQYPELGSKLLSIRSAMENIAEQYNIPPRRNKNPHNQVDKNVKSWLNRLMVLMVLITMIIQLATRL